MARATGTPELSADRTTLTFDIAPVSGPLPTGEYAFHATTALSDAHDPPNTYRAADGGDASLSLDVAPTFEAVTSSVTTMSIEFSEEVSGTTDATEWSIGGTAPSAVSDTTPDGVMSLTLTYATGDDGNPIPMGTGATPAVSYTGTNLRDSNGDPVATVTSQPSADGVAPTLVSVSFDGATAITAAFSEAMEAPHALLLFEVHDASTGGTQVAESTGPARLATPQGGTANSAIEFDIVALDPSGARLTTTLAAGTYHVDLEGAADAAGNDYDATDRDEATLDLAPTFTALFAGPRTIVLAASEALAPATVTVAAFPVTTADGAVDLAGTPPDPVRYTAGSPPHVAITLAAPATDGTAYTITPAASVTDAAGTPYAAGPVTVTFDATAAAPFAASTRSLTETAVTFGADLSGTLDASAWRILEGTSALAVSSVAVSGGTEVATPSSAVAISSAGARTLVIAHAALSSTAATPDVAHERPATVPSGGHLAAGGSEASDSLAAATDGAPPTFTAVTASATTVSVTLSEPSRGEVLSSDWRVTEGDAAPYAVSPRPTDLAVYTNHTCSTKVRTCSWRQSLVISSNF